MAHLHSNAEHQVTASELYRHRRALRILVVVLIPLGIWTLVGLIALWPGNVSDHVNADAAGYSVPGVTGVTLQPAVVATLAAHPNVLGMKNSSGDATLAAAYRRAAGNAPFVILAGSAYAAAGFLLTGLADGVILAAANVAPEAAGALVAAVPPHPVSSPTVASGASLAEVADSRPVVRTTVSSSRTVIAGSSWAGSSSLARHRWPR